MIHQQTRDGAIEDADRHPRCDSAPPAPRIITGRLYRYERTRRRVTHLEIAERLDRYGGVYAGQDRILAASWTSRDASWVSRIESGAMAKLDRETVLALCWALGCTEGDRDALVLAAGFTPLEAPAYDAVDDLLRWYRGTAALLPEPSATDAAAGRVA